MCPYAPSKHTMIATCSPRQAVAGRHRSGWSIRTDGTPSRTHCCTRWTRYHSFC